MASPWRRFRDRWKGPGGTYEAAFAWLMAADLPQATKDDVLRRAALLNLSRVSIEQRDLTTNRRRKGAFA